MNEERRPKGVSRQAREGERERGREKKREITWACNWKMLKRD